MRKKWWQKEQKGKCSDFQTRNVADLDLGFSKIRQQNKTWARFLENKKQNLGEKRLTLKLLTYWEHKTA